LIGKIHKIPWKFSCYQCYVICFCDCSKLITAFLFNQSLFRLLVVVFHRSVLLRIFSSFEFLLFFLLLHFNQKCLPSKTWKTAAAQKVGREAYILIIKQFNNVRRWALSTIAKTLATPNRIYLFPICELPTTIHAIVDTKFKTTSLLCY